MHAGEMVKRSHFNCRDGSYENDWFSLFRNLKLENLASMKPNTWKIIVQGHLTVWHTKTIYMYVQWFSKQQIIGRTICCFAWSLKQRASKFRFFSPRQTLARSPPRDPIKQSKQTDQNDPTPRLLSQPPSLQIQLCLEWKPTYLHRIMRFLTDIYGNMWEHGRGHSPFLLC